MYEGNFLNWLSSVLGLFNMTLNRILGFVPSRLYVGAYTGPAAPSARNFSPTLPEGSPTPRK